MAYGLKACSCHPLRKQPSWTNFLNFLKVFLDQAFTKQEENMFVQAHDLNKDVGQHCFCQYSEKKKWSCRLRQ